MRSVVGRLLPGPALGILTWAGAARAQSTETAPIEPPKHPALAVSPTLIEDVELPLPHPVFSVATVGGEIGPNPAAGAKLALFVTPFSGISLGVSAFFAPFTSINDSCTAACNLNPLLFRWMAELRIGTPYKDYSHALVWFGVSAGVAYLDEPRLEPSPSLALAAGVDLRLAPSLWLEFSPRFGGTEVIGSGSSFAGFYFSVGIEVGVRFDFSH